MRCMVGTSGFSYAPWRGAFYPPGLRAERMLAFYGSRFPAVEVNNTFYRMPSPAVLARWAGEVPDEFRFVVKAPRRLVDTRREDERAELVRLFVAGVSPLGDKLGAVYLQFPAYSRKDLLRLARLLDPLSGRMQVSVELRHPSWHDDEVASLLADRGAAWCAADVEGAEEAGAPSAFAATAAFGHVRLRRAGYSDAELGRWVERLRAQPWRQAFVFFKHEDEGRAPLFAERFRALWDAAGAEERPADSEGRPADAQGLSPPEREPPAESSGERSGERSGEPPGEPLGAGSISARGP